MKDITQHIQHIRQLKPIVHCITNPVTINDCANSILAVGGSPIMAHHILEVEEIASMANALVCNFGATDDFDSIFAAADAAQKKNHPIIIDPVGVTCSTYRRKNCIKLIQQTGVSCIRGNYEEILSLIYDEKIGRGLDVTGEHEEIYSEQMEKFARDNHVILVISGEKDYITDGTNALFVEGGDSMMKRMTGSGCMFSSLLGAFLSVEKSVAQAAVCSSVYKTAAQRAAFICREKQGGTMTFRMLLIDELSKL